MDTLEAKKASIDGSAERTAAETFLRFQQGDPEAMNAIVVQYFNRLIGFIRLFTRRTELAEELAQETLLEAWRRREEIRGAATLRPWLFAVAKSKAIKEMCRVWHREQLLPTEHFAAIETPGAGEAPGCRLQHDKTCRFLVAALEQLQPAERELVALRYFGELRVREVAEVMKMPMGSVGVKLARALEKIRAMMERQGLTAADFELG